MGSTSVSGSTSCRRSEARGLRGVAIAAWGLLAITAACARPAPRTNVLLVTFDTTRADHLSCYGYREPTTPNVDRLATEGALFDLAFSTNPITLPSHASIFTGTYPPFHGVRDNSTYVLRDDATTLAEVLSAAGYDTAAFVASFVLDSRFHLNQGFALYDDRIEAGWSIDEIVARAADGFGFPERKANQVTAAALQWLEHRAREPFFVWLHYFDPHQPINPPEPHHSRFANGYDGEIAFADEQLGRFLDALRARGQLDRTLVVFTADHGEGLMDHDEPTHALFVFDSTMHVPLVIRPPGGRTPVRVRDIASTVDIMPTVLDLLGVRAPAGVQGRSLLPAMQGAAHWPDRHVYFESLVGRLQCGWGELRGLRSAREKLIHGPRPRYYRVDGDPEEVFDRASKEPERVAALTAELARDLERWRLPAAQESVSRADPETVKRLAALGYVSGSVGGSRQVDESLAWSTGRVDPHERHRLFDLTSMAMEDLRNGSFLEGIRKLETVVAGDPTNPSALTALGSAYLLTAQTPARARTILERSLAVDPEQEQAHALMARILAARGDLAGAQAHYEAILRFMPSAVEAHSRLASVLQARGDSDGALEHLRAANRLDPSHLPTLVALGAAYGRRREHDQAGRFLEKAREIAPAHPAVLYNLAIWHLQGNDVPTAIAYLRQTIAADPGHVDAHTVLGRLLAQTGNPEEARRELTIAHRLATRPDRIAEIDSLLAGIGAR